MFTRTIYLLPKETMFGHIVHRWLTGTEGRSVTSTDSCRTTVKSSLSPYQCLCAISSPNDSCRSNVHSSYNNQKAEYMKLTFVFGWNNLQTCRAWLSMTLCSLAAPSLSSSMHEHLLSVTPIISNTDTFAVPLHLYTVLNWIPLARRSNRLIIVMSSYIFLYQYPLTSYHNLS